MDDGSPVARKLCDQFGMGDVDVMGVSWGGAMAQQYAFQYRNSVGKLILCATTAGMTMVPGKVSAISKMADARRYTLILIICARTSSGFTEKLRTKVPVSILKI